MGRRGRFAGGRQRAAAGTAAGFAGYGVSTSCMAGVAEDSARNNEDLQPDRASGRKTASGAGGGASLRHESCFNCCAVPPSGTRGWESCRVSMGTFAERKVVGAGAGVIRNPSTDEEKRKRKTKEKSGYGMPCPYGNLAARFGFGDVLGPIGSEFCVVDLQVFLDVAVMKNEVVAGAGFKEFLLQG